MSELNQVFHALADPTRRSILSALGERALAVGDVAEQFPISLNAVSKHIKVLEGAKLVERKRDGRLHYISLAGAPLADVRAWIAQIETFWSGRLNQLQTLIEERETHGKDT